MTKWTLHPDSSDELQTAFGSIDRVFSLEGKRITSDKLSEMIYLKLGDAGYYVKRYHKAGKGVRSILGRSRIRGEWESLQHFEKWGVPAARTLAFGAEKRGPFFKRGAIVTREIPDTDDLAQLAKRGDSRLKDSRWIQTVSGQLAHATRTMHDQGFAHGDLKWRNVLVTKEESSQIYLIDCPAGAFWIPPFLQYRIVKDLACLDKVAKYALSRTRRLRFYLDYLGQPRLDPKSRKQLQKVLSFFKGRE